MPDSSADYAIIAFGDIWTPSGSLDADQVFEKLFGNRLWYIMRPSRAVKAGTTILFYQNARGFRGRALVRNIEPDPTSVVCGRQTSVVFSHRVELDDCFTFGEPINIRDIVNDLQFVLNKTYWGQSLRSTPRSISASDFTKILNLTKDQ